MPTSGSASPARRTPPAGHDLLDRLQRKVRARILSLPSQCSPGVLTGLLCLALSALACTMIRPCFTPQGSRLVGCRAPEAALRRLPSSFAAHGDEGLAVGCEPGEVEILPESFQADQFLARRCGEELDCSILGVPLASVLPSAEKITEWISARLSGNLRHKLQRLARRARHLCVLV